MPTTVVKQNMLKKFTQNIMSWHLTNNKRIMPWKGEKDPYKIWLSEVILQQTRVEQGLEYYNNFVSRFPTIEKLALAKDDEVFKLWEGLGYYSRCRNLLFTARDIFTNYGGKFPNCYEEIVKLKGIGPYTASAISSFAYGLPHAVVDGNVYRVLSRYFGETIAIDSTQGKKVFNELAHKALYKKNSALYNQAIMDFGATVCKPQIAECSSCVLKCDCIAFNEGLVNKLPVKEKKLQKSRRWFYYFVFLVDNNVFVSKRTGKDIWHGLYEFYLYEDDKSIRWNDAALNKFLKEQLDLQGFSIKLISKKFTQQLTHQSLEGQFSVVEFEKIPAALHQFTKLPSTQLQSLPFPRFINMFLEEADFINRNEAAAIKL